MNNETQKPKAGSFSVKRFIFSSLGYFAIFALLLGIFYFVDSQMLAYDFLFAASAITALILGFYHGKYKNQSDVDAAVDADVEHVEEVIEEEIEDIEKKLHLK